MIQIFISYAREDQQVAKRLHADLRNSGVEPWLDVEDLLPGMRWQTALRSAIEESSYFIALMSTKSINKKGYVQKELCQAIEILLEFPHGRVFVIPARIEECTPNHPTLNEIQWVDLFPSYEAGVRKIIETLNVNSGVERISEQSVVTAQTPEKSAALSKASTWRRLGGSGIEYLVYVLFIFLIALLGPLTGLPVGAFGTLVLFIMVLVRDVSVWSIAKRAGKMRVVDWETRQPPSFKQAVLRNSYYLLLLLLMVQPYFQGVFSASFLVVITIDVLTIIVNPAGRRFGDFLAGTQVVAIGE